RPHPSLPSFPTRRSSDLRLDGELPLPRDVEAAVRLGRPGRKRPAAGGGALMAVEQRVENAPAQTGTDAAPDVRLEGVTKRFDDVVAVDDLSLGIEHGSFFALLGPSGCGKTTTLRMIGGFEEPTEGLIYLGDAEVSGTPPYKR